MKHPYIKEPEIKEIILNFPKLPLLSDKESDSIEALNESKNVWVRDGVTVTRPGLTTEDELLIYNGMGISNQTLYTDNCFESLDEGIQNLCAVVKKQSQTSIKVYPYKLDADGTADELTTMNISGTNLSLENLFFISSKSLINHSNTFMVTVVKSGGTDIVTVYELNGSTFQEVPINAFYKPTVLLNGRGNLYAQATDRLKGIAAEQSFESKGMIGGMKAYFITDGESTTYTLPYKALTSNQDETVICKLRGSISASFNIPTNSDASENVSINGVNVYAKIDRTLGTVMFYKSDNTVYTLPASEIPNNLEIEFYKTDLTEFTQFMKNVKRHGTYNSRHYFFGSGEKGSRLYFSGKNNCFYISEQNSLTVGEEKDKLSCIAKQNKYFVILKTSSVYRATVSETGTSVSEAIDLKKAVSPPCPKLNINLVNGNIGCNCPDSVALVSNRVFWANNDYTVYGLYGSNNYTEGNVYVLSENIANRLKQCKYNDLICCYAKEWSGYYILCIGDSIFIMDTRIASMRYPSNFKGVPTDISWYVWEIPEKNIPVYLFGVGTGFGFVIKRNYTTGFVLYSVYCQGESDRMYLGGNNPENTDISFKLSTPCCFMSDSLHEINLLGGKIELGCSNDFHLVFSDQHSGRIITVLPNESTPVTTLHPENFFLSSANFSRLSIAVSGKGRAVLGKMKVIYYERLR